MRQSVTIEAGGPGIAAADGAVCINYASGAGEAEAVGEIRDRGGLGRILRCDAAGSAAGQLDDLEMIPSQLYHFAPPGIFRQKCAPFEPACFEEMMRVYNNTLYGLSLFCLERRDAVAALSSTTAIDRSPRNALEFVMAKRASETLATTMAQTIPNLRTVIVRLPRVRTDQTTTIFPVPVAALSALMLPVVRWMPTTA